jgi:hypothetical protein
VRVFGRGATNVPSPQIEICSTGANGIPEACTGDDVVLGQGGTDTAGKFADGANGIAISPPLFGGEKIFAVDLQHDVAGRVVGVFSTGQIPDLNAWGATLLGVALLTAIAVRLRPASRR